MTGIDSLMEKTALWLGDLGDPWSVDTKMPPAIKVRYLRLLEVICNAIRNGTVDDVRHPSGGTIVQAGHHKNDDGTAGLPSYICSCGLTFDGVDNRDAHVRGDPVVGGMMTSADANGAIVIPSIAHSAWGRRQATTRA